MSTVIDEIVAERARQISVEGWTPEHDDGHKASEMARAAACYALLADPLRSFPVEFTRGISHYYARHEEGPQPVYKDVPKLWPWAATWWKPKGQRADLIRAAALIVAEIERIDRASAQAEARPKQVTHPEDV